MANEMRDTDFPDTPSGWAQRWAMEFKAAREEIKPWHARGTDVVNRYLDKGKGRGSKSRTKERRLNLFTSNQQMLMAILYGKTPQVDVTRKFGDSEDEVARVAGEAMERMLNGSIEKDSDTYAYVMQLCLEDRLLPGMGLPRLRYECEMDEPAEDAPPEQEAMLGPADPLTGQAIELAPAVPATPKKTYECVEIDYVPWKDQLWSAARTFLDVRWWAFKTEQGRKKLIETFGPEVGGKIPLNSRDKTSKGDTDKNNPWGRGDVWEIWDKENKKVWFFVEGYGEMLCPVAATQNEDGSVDDTLGLEGFWPFPRPMIGNTTTSGFIPEPDYYIAQDLYLAIDDLETRIYIIQKAINVRAIYDASMGDKVERLIDEGGDNQMIPVKGWLGFMEKGGLEAAVQFMPIGMLVEALGHLRDVQTDKIRQLDQITGMGDVVRGQSTNTQTTATENKIKGMFASVRVQALQDEFARLCSDTQKLKAEIISLHFDAETIIEESNLMRTPDANLAQQAVELIKSKFYQFRIQVKPESVSLTDFAAQQNERQSFLTGMTGYFTAAAPLLQALPQSAPFFLEIAQWFSASYRASSTIQGVFDRAIAAAKQAASQPPQPQGPPPPDPKIVHLQAKAQVDKQKTMGELQADLTRIGAETHAAGQQRSQAAMISVQEDAAKQKLRADPMTAMLHPTGVE